jgi:predicted small lipoprotein YifL
MFLALPHPRPRAGRVHTHLRLASVCAVLFLTACGRQGPALSGLPADVRALTGAHTRVVWVQSDGTDPRAQGEELVLMGLDTDDGLGERVISVSGAAT